MFPANDSVTPELLGVFYIEREGLRPKKSIQRIYDSLSIRLRGNGYFSTENTEICAGENEVLYIPASVPYMQSTNGEAILAIHFLSFDDHPDTKMRKLRVHNPAQVRDCFTTLYEAWSSQKDGYRLECMSLLYHLFYLLQQGEDTPGKREGSVIAPAMTYIHANFTREMIEVKTLAKLCYLSETYFRTVFKKLQHSTPNQYILELKLEYARQLIRSDLYSIAQVSELSGFSGTKYFARTFRQRYGDTPSGYRKRCRSSPGKIF